MRELSATELGWVAGILEGEGCFTPSRQRVKGKQYTYARIQLNMTDEDVIRRFRDTVGTGNLHGPRSYPNHPTWKPSWHWDCHGKEALELMRAILPLMGERRTNSMKESM